jgi:hypothetical protein
VTGIDADQRHDFRERAEPKAPAARHDRIAIERYDQ